MFYNDKMTTDIKIKDHEMFNAMRNIFYGGEFTEWLKDKKLPWAAACEYEEAKAYFEEQTGFKCADYEK